jgi:uncharacterized repeat protein (TIGR03803 family)
MEPKKLQWLKKAGVACLLLAATAVASPAQAFRTLVYFKGTNGGNPGYGSLFQDKDGNFYGTTQLGGANGCGTVFKMTPGGKLTTLHSFNGTDGCEPYAGLVLGADGNFYGTTGGTLARRHSIEGPCVYGSVFKITREGTLTNLHTFKVTDGYYPSDTLLLGPDGNFYGTTIYGGQNLAGTVFRITREGTLTTLHSFSFFGTDGSVPIAGLVLGTNGNFYGTTWSGGAYADGTVFKVTREGMLTTLHSFDGTDGRMPYAALVLGADGNFYGTTHEGGAPEYGGYGTVFKMTREGTLTTLHSFDVTDGQLPLAPLIQATDGTFYGTTQEGGYDGLGTVFKMTREGTLTTLYSFRETTDGWLPYAGVVLGTDGKVYGTTFEGGPYTWGTVFSLTVLRGEE